MNNDELKRLEEDAEENAIENALTLSLVHEGVRRSYKAICDAVDGLMCIGSFESMASLEGPYKHYYDTACHDISSAARYCEEILAEAGGDLDGWFLVYRIGRLRTKGKREPSVIRSPFRSTEHFASYHEVAFNIVERCSADITGLFGRWGMFRTEEFRIVENFERVILWDKIFQKTGDRISAGVLAEEAAVISYVGKDRYFGWAENSAPEATFKHRYVPPDCPTCEVQMKVTRTAGKVRYCKCEKCNYRKKDIGPS